MRRTLLATAGIVAATGLATAAQPSVDSTTRYRYADVRGVRVFFREAGSLDAPTILLLHGFPASSNQFATLIPLLADRFHVVAPDYPGFGLSEAPPPESFAYTFDNIAGTIDKLTDVLELKRYALFMNDYGGPVGFRLAVAHPERITAMVVQNAVVHEEGLTPAWAARRLFWQERSAHEVGIVNGFTDPESFRKRHVGTSPRPERYDPTSWVEEEALMRRPGQHRIQADLSYDYRTNVAAYPQWQAWLREHRPRLMVAWGKYDTAFAVPGATAFLREVPEAEVHILNAGHFATDEAVDQVAELTRRFLLGTVDGGSRQIGVLDEGAR